MLKWVNMLKKILVLWVLTSYFSFANEMENSTAYREPKYKISEIDMKILIRQLNNIEQCIYPDLSKPGYQTIYANWSLAESLTMQYFEHQVLKELIGEKHFKLLQDDKLSSDYFNALHRQLNHQKANVDKELCEDFKPKYHAIHQKMQAAIIKR